MTKRMLPDDRLPEDDPLWQLLADEATEGLDEEGRQELQRLLEQHDVDAESLQLAAAAFDLSESEAEQEQMSADLQRRVLEQAEAHFAVEERVKSRSQSADEGPSRLRFLDWFGKAGWLVAAAAVLLLVWTNWPQRELTTAERRSRLMESASDAVRVAWSRPEKERFRGVEGDIVWSNERQEGYMRLKGMPKTAKEKVYQLWIVDPTIDEFPVDGGVFEVNEEGEVIVPVNAKLRIRDPELFAITLEERPGVVKSDGPLLVTAKVPKV